jgi:hypothetical protein
MSPMTWRDQAGQHICEQRTRQTPYGACWWVFGAAAAAVGGQYSFYI